jgi:hypothetical protein
MAGHEYRTVASAPVIGIAAVVGVEVPAVFVAEMELLRLSRRQAPILTMMFVMEVAVVCVMVLAMPGMSRGWVITVMPMTLRECRAGSGKHDCEHNSSEGPKLHQDS